MNPLPTREEELFVQALARPAAERPAFVATACADDPALHARVARLLDAHEHARSFLESPPDADLARTVAHVAPGHEEKTGDVIGRYKLLQKIGEGGCGVVYMAEQQEPVVRRVALKVIKLGMDTREVVARFEAERQALALMDHPNIARVLDGGATDTGRPFFVMELVRGVPITKYCDEQNLATAARLELFTAVCHAVQHAHQKGIIHRDLKPSNILVTLHDGVAVPKVIDFGIAKATQGKLTDSTLFTAFEQFIGTPAYMSPEQAEMSGLDIDTRSDIYSLGVLLYELLTGRPPFDPKTLVERGLDEIRRIIREVDPPRPSTRLSTLADLDRATIAKQRGTGHEQLSVLLRGDLDWIVMRCLEKDRTRRYETANALALDLLRHLHDEPVVARPPSTGYRALKFLRRNKLIVAGTAGIAAALVLGATLAVWQAVRATRAESVARRERDVAEAARVREAAARTAAEASERKERTAAVRSAQIARFLREMLQGIGPQVALGRDTQLLRAIVDATAARFPQLSQQPEVEVELRETVGAAYRDIGEYAQAETLLRAALAQRRTLHTGDDPGTATVSLLLGTSLQGLAKFDEAETMLGAAVAMRRRLFGDEHLAVAEALHALGVAQGARRGLARSLRSGGATPAEAEKHLREALAIRRKALGNEHAEVAATLAALGRALADQNKSAEAESSVREALAIQRKTPDTAGLEAAASLYDLGAVLARQRRWPEAEKAMRESLELRRTLLGNSHPDVAACLGRIAGALFQQRRDLPAAEAMHREAMAIHRRLFDREHPAYVESVGSLATVLSFQGKLAEAESLYREALVVMKGKLGAEQPELVLVLGALGMLLERQGKLADAETVYREALPGWTRRGADAPEAAQVPFFLANLLDRQGRREEAEPLFVAVEEHMRPAAGEAAASKRAAHRMAVQRLVKFYTDWKRPEKADEWKRRLGEIERPPSPAR